MTFAALLTKELRLRLRRERFVWVIISYLLIMGVLGFGFLQQQSAFSSIGYQSYLLSQIGGRLYGLLAYVQLVLIVFIAPAFTASAINGEKERQTFDLLLCSKLSSFSLLAAKLVAGLANALLLILASIPLFSLVFFFGGVSPAQVLSAILVFVVTTIVAGTFGLFCSTVVRRPPVSTTMAYMFCVLWMTVPWVILILLLLNPLNSYSNPQLTQNLLVWNPIAALTSTISGTSGGTNIFSWRSLHVPFWEAYTVLSLLITVVLFLLSVVFVKPNPIGRLRARLRFLNKKSVSSTQGIVSA